MDEESPMREFEDEAGRRWIAGVVVREGRDFKGRYFFTARPVDHAQGAAVALGDVRWNSERTARRTLETMSEVELRRRLRQALGRAAPAEQGSAAR
jgi:hypothetical protein